MTNFITFNNKNYIQINFLKVKINFRPEFKYENRCILFLINYFFKIREMTNQVFHIIINNIWVIRLFYQCRIILNEIN